MAIFMRYLSVNLQNVQTRVAVYHEEEEIATLLAHAKGGEPAALRARP